MRPAHWGRLHDGDPVPGEPGAVERWAASLARTADEIYEQASLLRRLGEGEWEGEAGTVFAAKAHAVSSDLAATGGRYRQVGRVLAEYAQATREAQRQADALRAGLPAVERALAENAPPTTSPFAGLVPGPPEDPSVVMLEHARSQRYAAATQALEEMKRALARIVAARDEAGDHAARQIRGYINNDDLKDSAWERVRLAVREQKDLIDGIKKALTLVSLVLTVAAIFFPPLALVALAIGVLVAATTLVQFLNGDASKWDLAWDLVGIVPGAKMLRMLKPLKGLQISTRGSVATAHGRAVTRHARTLNRHDRIDLNHRIQTGAGDPVILRARLNALRAQNNIDGLMADGAVRYRVTTVTHPERLRSLYDEDLAVLLKQSNELHATARNLPNPARQDVQEALRLAGELRSGVREYRFWGGASAVHQAGSVYKDFGPEDEKSAAGAGVRR